MEIYHVISVGVPLVLAYVLPVILHKTGNIDVRYRLFLYSACLLFFISWYLPSPIIDGQDTSFVTHFIGGGVFSFLLWEYLRLSLNLKLRYYTNIAALFALVSSLGVINELFEFALVKLNIASILLTDTSYDLVANTLGAAVAYGVSEVIRKVV